MSHDLKEVRECAYLVEKCRIMLGSLRKHEEVVLLESKMMSSHGMDKPCHHLKAGHFRWEILQGMNKLTFEETARKPV